MADTDLVRLRALVKNARSKGPHAHHTSFDDPRTGERLYEIKPCEVEGCYLVASEELHAALRKSAPALLDAAEERDALRKRIEYQDGGGVPCACEWPDYDAMPSCAPTVECFYHSDLRSERDAAVQEVVRLKAELAGEKTARELSWSLELALRAKLDAVERICRAMLARIGSSAGIIAEFTHQILAALATPTEGPPCG